MKTNRKRLAPVLVCLVAIWTVLFFSGLAQAAPPTKGASDLSTADAAMLLSLHNDWRQKYSVPTVTWDDSVAAVAQDWANQMAASGNFAHRPNNRFGENIWAGSAGFFGLPSVVNSWGSEVENYNFATNTCAAGKVCGHFTQLVWANTTKIGCGKATGNGNDYVVCNYDPPGNFVGEAPGASPAAAPVTNPSTSTPTATVGTAATLPSNTLTPTVQPTPKGTAGLTSEQATVMLNTHNDWRKKYNVPLLIWDDAIADAAQVWAEQIATTNSFSRPAGNTFGSNNYFGGAGISPESPVNWWGKHDINYDLATNTCAAGNECRQFTQLVWSKSTKVGCGKATANGNDFFVCNYDPPGNITGEMPGASLVPLANTATATMTLTPTLTATFTATATFTSTLAPTGIVTATTALTQTLTPTLTPTGTLTATLPVTGTVTATSPLTPTATLTATTSLTTTLAATPTANGTTAPTLDFFATALLTAHNDWRQRYSVPPLVWDDAVAAVAQDWANRMAASGNFAHRPNNAFGENIWGGSSGFFSPLNVVNAWGSEVEFYDFATNTCATDRVCGHFTQLVWAATTKVGCGKATGNGDDYYVCNYDPPGNFVGEKPGASPATAPVNLEPTATPIADVQPTAVPAADAQPVNTTPETALPFDTPNLSLPANSSGWYTVPSAGTNTDVTIRIPGGGSGGLMFFVFAPSQIPEWQTTTHLGIGSPEGDDLVWRGNSFEDGPYLLLVNNNTTVPVAFTIANQ